MSKVLLTGATGFIGSHVLEALTTAGWSVTVLVRPQADLELVRAHQVEIRYGDIRDLTSLCDAARDCTQIVHTAGLVTDWGRTEQFRETNVTGTLNVLEACRRCGIRQATITGSISSYGEEHSHDVKNEQSPYRSHYPYFLDAVFPSGLNRYRDSKAAATQEAVTFAQKHQLNVTVLEPVWVFGEREFGTGFYSYLEAVQAGQHFMPGSSRNRFHVVYARDLAKAYLLAVEKGLPGVERLIIGNPTAEPMRQVFELFCQVASLPTPRLLPKWMVYPIALGLELIYTLAHRPQPPLLTRGRVNMFYDSIQFSTEKAKAKLGFDCQYSLEEGIRRTVAWYQDNHYL
jgi:nucleoside-diphosphate-sugar epimerase